MFDAIATASGGLRASAAQFESAAKNVVKATVPGSNQDLSAAIVDTRQSETAYKANLAVFKSTDRMMGDLLDILA
jgi:flagellar basal body rod protein FlgC